MVEKSCNSKVIITCSSNYALIKVRDRGIMVFHEMLKIILLNGHFSQRQAKVKAGKNPKSIFFPTGLKVHLKDMF